MIAPGDHPMVQARQRQKEESQQPGLFVRFDAPAGLHQMPCGIWHPSCLPLLTDAQVAEEVLCLYCAAEQRYGWTPRGEAAVMTAAAHTRCLKKPTYNVVLSGAGWWRAVTWAEPPDHYVQRLGR